MCPGSSTSGSLIEANSPILPASLFNIAGESVQFGDTAGSSHSINPCLNSDGNHNSYRLQPPTPNNYLVATILPGQEIQQHKNGLSMEEDSLNREDSSNSFESPDLRLELDFSPSDFVGNSFSFFTNSSSESTQEEDVQKRELNTPPPLFYTML